MLDIHVGYTYKGRLYSCLETYLLHIKVSIKHNDPQEKPLLLHIYRNNLMRVSDE